MSENFDPNKVAAEAMTALLKSSFESVLVGVSNAMRTAWLKLFEDFATYTEQIYRKNRNVRILCVKDRDVDLHDVYVESMFSCGNKTYTDQELIYRIREGQNIVINGNGGAGKTFFMRHLWLTVFANPKELMPVFIELRNLNELSKYDLKTFIRVSIVDKGLNEDVFDYFCKRGRFCFILDGFDEVAENARETLQSQILKMASTFDRCVFVLSSRPDKRFSGWQSFDVYQSEPFNLNQVNELVDKVPFHEKSKRVFKKKLDDQFFEENRSFLSNPLLVIMMLMTFTENMEIPKSMNIFYEQAFNTLFVWHDATKGYARAKAMDIDQFKKSFGVFCLLSYCNQIYEFSAHEIHNYIRKSNKVLGFDFDADEIAKDYVEAVNLMQQDGLSYVFIHRSFQEYFAAYALTTILRDKVQDFLRVLKGRYYDSFLKIAYEIDREFISREFVIPEYKRVLKGLPSKRSARTPFRTLAAATVSYVFVCSTEFSSSEKKKDAFARLSYMTIETTNEALPLVGTFSKLQRTLSDHEPSLGFGSVFVHATLMRVSAIVETLKRTEDRFSIVLSFSNDDYKIELRDVKADGHAIEEIEEIIYAALRENHEQALIFSDEFREQIDSVKLWCESRISESANREKSIDEILGLH